MDFFLLLNNALKDTAQQKVPVQSQQQNHQEKVKNMFKVYNKTNQTGVNGIALVYFLLTFSVADFKQAFNVT